MDTIKLNIQYNNEIHLYIKQLMNKSHETLVYVLLALGVFLLLAPSQYNEYVAPYV